MTPRTTPSSTFRSFLFLALSASLPAGLLACGDDSGGGGNNNPDASTDVDADTNADADTTPDADLTPDAEVPDTGLAAARAAADGTVNVEVEATVTYLKPAVGTDPAGFFLQEAQTGPALFVAVDPTTLTPVPAVGDLVTLTITEMGTAANLRQALAIDSLAVVSSDNDVTALAQDVNALTDLVTALDTYEAELVTASFTLQSVLSGAGAGHLAGAVNTAGVIDNPDLRIRVTSEVQTHFGLTTGCTASIANVPLWRFAAVAQLSAWSIDDIEVTSCPAPVLVTATPNSPTEVALRFDRSIDAASLTDVAAQITFDNGLTAASAVVTANVVTVTTSTMQGGQTYTVTIADTLLDILGTGVAANDPATTFVAPGTSELTCDDGLDDDVDGFVDCLDSDCAGNGACNFTGQLYLWEVDADQVMTDTVEFVELRNRTGATVDLAAEGYFLLLLNGSNLQIYNAIALTGSVADDGLFVAGSEDATLAADQTFGVSNILQNGADGVLLVQCATCTDPAVDFPNGGTIAAGATFTSANGAAATKVDALAYDTNDNDIAELLTALNVTAQFNEGGNGDAEAHSNQRTSLSGWTAAPPNPKASGIQ